MLQLWIKKKTFWNEERQRLASHSSSEVHGQHFQRLSIVCEYHELLNDVTSVNQPNVIFLSPKVTVQPNTVLKKKIFNCITQTLFLINSSDR